MSDINSLLSKANDILDVKETKIIPGNIKKNVKIFDVVGTYDNSPTLQSKEVTLTENGTTAVRPDTGYDALSRVNVSVNVPGPRLEIRDVTIDTNGTTNFQPHEGYDGISDFIVTVEGVLDTSDATATASDMAWSKTAYVNGIKLTGSLGTTPSGQTVQANNVTYNGNFGFIYAYYNLADVLIRAGGGLHIPQNLITTAINLTPEILKKDETVLGVTGTYEGTKVVLPDNINFGKPMGSAYVTDFGWLADVDTSNITTAQYMFGSCTNMTTVGLFDTSNITTMEGMFYNCSNLTSLPLFNTEKVVNMNSMLAQCATITSLPNFNTSNVVGMAGMCASCSALTTVPQLDTSKLLNFQNTFGNCISLSGESLNNILAMCINATAYIQRGTNMTLSYIGLSSTQAETCQTLSNWDAFVAAGWTSGY